MSHYLDTFLKDRGVFGNPLSFRASEWCSSMRDGTKHWWVGGNVATTIAAYGVQQLVNLHVSTWGKMSFVLVIDHLSQVGRKNTRLRYPSRSGRRGKTNGWSVCEMSTRTNWSPHTTMQPEFEPTVSTQKLRRTKLFSVSYEVRNDLLQRCTYFDQNSSWIGDRPFEKFDEKRSTLAVIQSETVPDGKRHSW